MLFVRIDAINSGLWIGTSWMLFSNHMDLLMGIFWVASFMSSFFITCRGVSSDPIRADRINVGHLTCSNSSEGL